MPQSRNPSTRGPARGRRGRARRAALPLALLLLLGPAPGAATAAPPAAGTGPPKLMMLPFAVPPTGGIPYSPRFQGILSREIPREIGRRMAATIEAEVLFFAPKMTVAGHPQLVVSQTREPAAQAIAIGSRGGAAFVLDGVVSATDKLKFRVRMLDVASGQPLWSSVYEAPTAGAGHLLQQAAHDLALALPRKLGAAAAKAPFPEHEPSWSALIAYLKGEDLRFLQEQGVAQPSAAPVYDAFLEAIDRDPAYDAPREALAQTAWAEIARGSGPLAGPMGALERLVALRPDALSYAALARGQALAGEKKAAQKSWARTVEIDPGYAPGWIEIANGRLAAGDYADAADALGAALALGIRSPLERARVRRDLGGAYLEMDKPDAAITALEASVKDNPKDPETYDRLGRAYEEKGREPGSDPERWAERAYDAYRTSSRLRGLPVPPPRPPGGVAEAGPPAGGAKSPGPAGSAKSAP